MERYRSIDKVRSSKFQLVSLVKICEITSSKRIFQEEYVKEGIPFYRTKEIVELNRKLPISLELFISKEKYSEIKSKFDVPNAGDILVSAVGTIGISWVVNDDREFYFKDGNLLWIKNIRNADPYYIKNVLDFLFQYRLNEFINGAAYNALTIVRLKQVQIPLPPLEIQKEIVAEIEGWQKIIDGARQVVENYKPQIDIDPEWPMVELGEVCEKITDGTHKTPTYTEEGIPFLRVTDVTNSNYTKKFISVEEHNELVKRCKPEKDDVLYSKNGTIGVAKLVDWDYEFSIFVSLALLKPNKKLLIPKYLEIFLNSENAMSQAVAHSKSGTVTNLHLIEIKQMKIPLPDLATQQKVVETIGKENDLVDSNKKLISIFEQKIKDKISKVWGE
jgi:restriction endonuclease S subunit